MKGTNLDKIYQMFFKDVYYYIFSLCHDHYVTEDILQETFFRAYLHFEELPKNSIKPWLFKVAHNVFIDYIRISSKSLKLDEKLFRDITYTNSPEEEYIKKEEFHYTNEAIKKLPSYQKQAIVLCDFFDLSCKEAADVINISVGYLKVLLFRARQKLRKDLKEKF